jgi:hypothetical protein
MQKSWQFTPDGSENPLLKPLKVLTKIATDSRKMETKNAQAIRFKNA